MNDENELLEPLATEAGQEAIVRAIRDISSLEYAVRAEQAASQASAKAGEASQSAIEASDAEDKAKDWATKTDTYVEQQIITIPSEQEGEEPTIETINLYSARYYAALAQDIYNNMSFDSVPTENSTNMVNSGTVYSALDLKADKSTIYTKTETDNLINTRLAELVASAPAALDTLQELATALGNDPNFATTIATQLGNKADKSTTYTKTEVDTLLADKADSDDVQTLLTFDDTPTANSDNPVKSGGIKTALDGKQDTLTFDSTPTENSTNPVTSGGVYTALQNIPSGGGSVTVDSQISTNSQNPVSSAGLSNAFRNILSTQQDTSIIKCDEEYYADTKDEILFENGDRKLYKSNDIPVIAALYNYSDYWNFRVMSLVEEGTLTYGNTTTNVTGTYVDKNGVTWYWRSNQLNAGKTSSNYPILNNGSSIGGYNNDDVCKLMLQSSNQYFPNSQQVALDSSPTYGSSNLVNSGAIYEALQNFTPSGGGSGSITIDSVPTENSQNAVSSGGVYDALQNLPSGGGSVDVYDLKTPVINGYSIKSANSAYYVAEKGKLICPPNVYTHTDIPSLYAVYKNNNYYMTPILICPIQDGATLSRNADGSGIDSNNKTYKQYYDPDREITWYCATDANMLYSWSEVLNSATANNIPMFEDCHDWLSACKKLIQLAEPVIKVRTIEENLFSPTDFTLSSGDTISSDTLKALINYPRPIVVNNETYYFVKEEKGTSYYENPNNTIEVSSSWVITITAKSSGGSSITVDSTITQGGTNPVEGGAIYDGLSELGSGLTSLSQAMLNKQDRLTFDTTPTADSSNPVTSGGVYNALQNLPTGSGDVTTNTDQNITGTKTFVGSKKVAFKQSTTNDKLGFTLFGNTGTERGYLEFNPTNTVDGVAGLMTLGNYATSAASLTQVGFRRYSNISGASGAYNLLMPMVADARTPFSLTTTYTNFYLPLGFTDGTTTVKTAKSGVVDLSPLLASLEARIAALEGN